MAKGRIGLDIGSTAVRSAELSVSRQPSVVRAGQEEATRAGLSLQRKRGERDPDEAPDSKR